MPIYSWEIKTPASTEQKIRKEIEGDYITKVRVRFPPGPTGLLKVAFFYGEMQIFPYESGTYFQGDDEVIEWDEYFKMHEKPFPLTIYCKNEDDTYEHSVYIIVVTKYSEELLGEIIAKAIAKKLSGLYRAITGVFRW